MLGVLPGSWWCWRLHLNRFWFWWAQIMVTFCTGSGLGIGHLCDLISKRMLALKPDDVSDFSFGSDILFIIFLLPLFAAVICSAITSRLILAAWSLSMHTDTVTSSLESTPSFSRKSILKKVSLKRTICRKEINREMSYIWIKFDSIRLKSNRFDSNQLNLI